jgi:hypothetical protein
LDVAVAAVVLFWHLVEVIVAHMPMTCQHILGHFYHQKKNN